MSRSSHRTHGARATHGTRTSDGPRPTHRGPGSPGHPGCPDDPDRPGTPGPTPRPRVAVALAAAALALAALGPALAASRPALAASRPALAATPTQPGWEVGAASADITPLPYLPSRDATEFPTCSTAVFSGPRLFDLEEPYVDANRNGRFDLSVDPTNPGAFLAEPFCDANANGRRDTLYDSGQLAQELLSVHDHAYARAFAVRDPQGHAVLIAEVTSQGLFSNVTSAVRDLVLAQVPAGTGVVIGATHNESTPDDLGLYGAPDVGGVIGGTSGIDDYYTAFLERQTAAALVAAYRDLAPGSLQVIETREPAAIHQNLSTTFPTTDDAAKPVAVDPDVRVLRATRPGGAGVFTVLNMAAHNQEIGHHDNRGVVSEDWPGYFSREVEARLGGVAMFMPSDIGSIEDPVATPPPTPQDHEGTFGQAQATGGALAGLVLGSLGAAQDVLVGAVQTRRDVYDTPLENNLFRAAAAAGIFGPRQLYTAGQPTGRVGSDLRTEVSLVDLGPEVELVTLPGEAFPALTLGSRWGVEEASCPSRPNPPVPLWHGHATHRFQMGLGGDMLGYLEPPWGWATEPGVIVDPCATDPQSGRDPAGHKHKLETESLGPQSAADAAAHLTALLDADAPDPAATIRRGRYLTVDGAVTRDARAAVAVWLAPEATATALVAGRGTIVALPGITAFGSTPVTSHGQPMDGNGLTRSGGDLQVRGFRELGGNRWYVDLYPSLSAPALGRAVTDPGDHAAAAAPGSHAGGQPGTGAAAGRPRAPHGALAATGSPTAVGLLALTALAGAVSLRRAGAGRRARRG